jgi:hypothetical protein
MLNVRSIRVDVNHVPILLTLIVGVQSRHTSPRAIGLIHVGVYELDQTRIEGEEGV